MTGVWFSARLLAASIACCMSAVAQPAAAQIDRSQLQKKPRDAIAPGNQIITRFSTRTVVLRDLPANMAHVSAPPGWTTIREAPAPAGAIGGGAGSAAYVVRQRMNATSNECRSTLNDSFDLTAIKERGFDILELRLEPLPEPQVLVEKPKYYTRPAVAGGAVGVSVIPGHSPAYGGMPVFCWAGYRIHVTVRGPRDIDPITGRKLQAQRPVN